MRPICLTLVAAALVCCGCATTLQQFQTRAEACTHMETAEVIDRLREPCRYAEALAVCMELPDRLRAEVVRECEEQKQRIAEKVRPAHVEPAAD